MILINTFANYFSLTLILFVLFLDFKLCYIQIQAQNKCLINFCQTNLIQWFSKYGLRTPGDCGVLEQLLSSHKHKLSHFREFYEPVVKYDSY